MTERILLFVTTVARSVHRLLAHTCTKTPTPLVNCIVNDAVVHACQLCSSLVSCSVHPRLIDSLLDDAEPPYYHAVDQTEIGAVRWKKKSRWDEIGCCLLDIVLGVCIFFLICDKFEL